MCSGKGAGYWTMPHRSRPSIRALPINPLATRPALLRLLAEDEPLLVALDDVQWLDDPSAAAMQFAFRRLAKEPVGVLATVRRTRTSSRPRVGPGCAPG